MAQAVGLNRSTVGRRRIVGDSFIVSRFFFMAVGAPFMFIEAAVADVCAAVSTGFQAAMAVVVVAGGAAACAAGATRIVTATAGRLTIGADFVATFLARITFALVDHRATVRAGAAAPQSEFNERALWVVRS